MLTPSTTATPTKKPLTRRLAPDRSQQIRRAVQLFFLALNAWIAVEFFLWFRYFETNGQTPYIARPAGIDGWLPIAGLMNLKYSLLTHHIAAMHPAAMVLLVIFLLSSLLLKKSFCAWLCPVGTLSEYLWKLGQKLFGRTLTLPRWLDIPLRALKYLLLAAFAFIVISMSADALDSFMLSPFGIIADVKMLNFFRHLGIVGAAVLVTLALLSVMIKNFWCRYLCPYGALMGIVSTLSPIKIRRDQTACIDCNKCSNVCPSHLDPAHLLQVRSVECTGCMTCIAACPAENALQFALPPNSFVSRQEILNQLISTQAIHPDSARTAIAARWHNRVLQPRTVAAILAILFFTLFGIARLTHHWQTPISRDVYQQLIPNADTYTH